MITNMRYLILLLLFFINAEEIIAQEITWYKDIAPLIQNKCASCHHDGGGAPFSLLSYEDVTKRASFIRDVVKSRYMPPWRPDNS